MHKNKAVALVLKQNIGCQIEERNNQTEIFIGEFNKSCSDTVRYWGVKV